VRLAAEKTSALPGARDALAAVRAAGERAVGVATGSFTAAQLAEAGAELVLGTLEAFPAWYRELGG
jgi:phosphoglycolate phosphatase-like HAD superfamily hydrolase